MRRRPVTGIVAAICCVGGLCAALLAKDPLALIPADAPCVVVLPNLASTTAKASALAKKIKPDIDAYCVEAFGEDINLSPGGWDTASPVVLILTRPEFDKSSLLVAFKPKNTKNLIVKAGIKEEMPGRCDCPVGPCWIMVRGDVAFAAQKRSAFRIIKDFESGRSFADTMDSTERKMLEDGDVFVRVNMSRWREKIMAPFALVSQMISLGITAEADPEHLEASQAMASWFIRGLQTVIEQMDSITLSGELTENSLRFTHHHRFATGKTVATYLGSVTNERKDRMALLPDRPFWIAMASNWVCPPEQSLSTRITEYIMNFEPIGEKMKPDKHDRLIENIRSYYGQLKGSSLMMSAPMGSLFPMEMIGSYQMDDAAKGLAQLNYIQENASEAVSMMIPGAKMRNKFEDKVEKQFKYSEMPFTLDDLSPKLREEIETVYGSQARYQTLAFGKQEILFCVSQPPMSVIELAIQRQKNLPGLSANAQVQKTVRLLQNQPNMLVLVDADRLLAAAPEMAISAASGRPGPARSTTEIADAGPSSQTLVGWSCVVGGDALTGQLAMCTDDFVRAVEGVQRMAVRIKEMGLGPQGGQE